MSFYAGEIPAETSEHDNAELDRQVLSKVSWRLIPFMLLLYVIAYLDRINVSFAGLQMNRDLHFNELVFGTGLGSFFLGYFLFGVPSNIMLSKLGARRWIALIMVVWGAVSTAMICVTDAFSFYLLRFMLGAAEAGFFPGMILYLTYWFPGSEHARAVARFMTAIPISGVMGGLIASRALAMHGLMGLPGWKWLFIVTGVPAVMLGCLVFFMLSEGPSQCSWLSDAKKKRLIEKVSQESKPKAESARADIFKNGQVWHLALIYFCLTLGMYGFQLWLPQIIQSFGSQDDSHTALLSALPALFQAAGMIIVAHNSDRLRERRLHVSLSALTASIALYLCGVSKDPVSAMCFLCLSAFGIWATVGPFWSIPTSLLHPASAAAGIALINSCGNLGGFAGPYIVGLIKWRCSDFIYSLSALAISLMVAAVLVLTLRTESRAESGTERY